MPVRSVSQGRPPERPSGRPAAPPPGNGGSGAGRPVGPSGPGGPQRPRTTRNVAPPPPPQRTDPFPYIMGGIIGALVVGLVLVIFLLLNNNQNNGSTGAVATNSGSSPNTLPTTDAASLTPEPTVELAPRMPLAEFKALYDDPAKRPLIVDVRAAEAYQQGHIQGAVSIPEADV
ncbi:MAG: hypothetical protein QOH93_266, partial [Chloroflexia bacterium]|nr:hypothetical protein [Chloroflexia bacterium]